MAKLVLTWNNLGEMAKYLQDVSKGVVSCTDAEKFVIRQASEEYFNSVLDKVLMFDGGQAYTELEIDPITLELGGQKTVFSISRIKKYDVDPAAIQAAGFKNQTEMFNSVAGSSDTLFEGLFRKKTSIYFDSKKAEKIYNVKGAGSELIRVSEVVSLKTKKGGK